MESVKELIRQKTKCLSDLVLLDLDPTLKNIYGEMEGDEVFIVNEFYKARGFRKLHIESAVFGSSLQILHSVFFPQPIFNLPIFIPIFQLIPL